MKEAFIVDGSDKVEGIPLNNKKGGNVETQTRIRKKKEETKNWEKETNKISKLVGKKRRYLKLGRTSKQHILKLEQYRVTQKKLDVGTTSRKEREECSDGRIKKINIILKIKYLFNGKRPRLLPAFTKLLFLYLLF